jgi:peptide chain release factor 2
MTELKERLAALETRFLRAYGLQDFRQQVERVAELQALMNQPDFWRDQDKARALGQELSRLEKNLAAWNDLKSKIRDLSEIFELDEEDKSVDLSADLEKEVEQCEQEFSALELKLLLGGKYDNAPAMISIHAGTGGTDAQDWAGMILRMYLRFCERQGWTTKISFSSMGAEAGIKSVYFEVEGEFAYGYLKSEAGVHRLVRISPFDAEKMRHTSFAMVEVLPFLEEVADIEIKPEDLRIETFRSGGHGGQSVNTTDSAVRIIHLATGITVGCQNERSQAQNKDKALKMLKSKLQRYYETEVEDERQKLRGEFTEAAWGNQARSYVLHPYKLVKDHRTNFETDQVEKVLDGDLLDFVEAYLRSKVGQNRKLF